MGVENEGGGRVQPRENKVGGIQVWQDEEFVLILGEAASIEGEGERERESSPDLKRPK